MYKNEYGEIEINLNDPNDLIEIKGFEEFKEIAMDLNEDKINFILRKQVESSIKNEFKNYNINLINLVKIEHDQKTLEAIRDVLEAKEKKFKNNSSAGFTHLEIEGIQPF